MLGCSAIVVRKSLSSAALLCFPPPSPPLLLEAASDLAREAAADDVLRLLIVSAGRDGVIETSSTRYPADDYGMLVTWSETTKREIMILLDLEIITIK